MTDEVRADSKISLSTGLDFGCVDPNSPWYVPDPPEVCASTTAGFNIGLLNDDPFNFTIGGEVYLDFTVEVAGYAVTVSPVSYGLTVGRSSSQGICASTKFSAPGPIPGKIDIKPCLEVSVVSDGSKVALKLDGSSFEACVSGYCADITINALSATTPYVDLGNIPDLYSQEPVAPEFPNTQGI
jgi:hypothetical protein